jgi:hypothetical protein
MGNHKVIVHTGSHCSQDCDYFHHSTSRGTEYLCTLYQKTLRAETWVEQSHSGLSGPNRLNVCVREHPTSD